MHTGLPLTCFINSKRLIEGTIVPDIAQMLTDAYASEWLAYFQYWTGAQFKEGLVKALLLEHAKDELKHAGWLFDAILELDEKPPLDLDQLSSYSPCKYQAPSIPKKIITQNIAGEVCAISMYQHILDTLDTLDSSDRDYGALYQTIKKIQREEQEHKEELESIN